MLSPCSTVPAKTLGDGLDAAVGMPGKSGKVVFRNIVAEIIEQQERVELLGVSEAKCAAQMYACTLESRFRFNEPLDRADRHTRSPLQSVIDAEVGLSGSQSLAWPTAAYSSSEAYSCRAASIAPNETTLR